MEPRAKKGVAQKTRGAATPMARGEKNGIYGENVSQRNISPPILRPGAYYCVVNPGIYWSYHYDFRSLTRVTKSYILALGTVLDYSST